MSVLALATRPTEGETDDRHLVAGVRGGDDRAFELLYERYQPRIAAYVRGMVRDHGRAEDITQEVFIAALRRLREDSEREILFKPWIFEIAKNRCIDAFRRTRYASEVSLDARDAVGADEHDRLSESGATPDSAVEGKVAIDNLCGAFGGLSRVHHDILVLREFEGLSYREIGDRLGMSRAAVESTLFRARKRLSEEYEELVSGERCLCVQHLVDDYGARPPGLRDRRRMSRHLAHCEPCRRYARRAGVDLGAAARPAGAAARIAAFLPLPAFLRGRWGDEEATAAPLLGHGGAVSQWSANAATMLDPAMMSSWTKAVATAATVAVAGMGAGAAFTDRAALDGFRDAGARPGALGIFADGRDAATAPAQSPTPATAEKVQRGGRNRATSAPGAATTYGPHPRAAAGRAASAAPAAQAADPRAAGDRRAGRPFDSSVGKRPPLARPTDRRGAPDVPPPGEALGRVLGAVGPVGAVGSDPVQDSGPAAGVPDTPNPRLLDGVAAAPLTDTAATGRQATTATPAATGQETTASTDSVSSTVSDTVATTIASLQSFAG